MINISKFLYQSITISYILHIPSMNILFCDIVYNLLKYVYDGKHASLWSQTDPENEDYAPEHGAVRTFQAERLAELEAERLKREREEEEANNPMKVS